MATQKGGLRLVVENYDKFITQTTAASQSMQQFGQAAQQTAAQVSASSGAYQDADTNMQALGKAAGDSATQIELTEGAYKKLGRQFLLVGAASGTLLAAMGLQASRIEELAVLLEVTRDNAIYLAEAQGDMAKASALSSEAVQEQVQGIRDLHLSGEVANRTVADLIRYNLDWTKATELARLAQDAATFAMQDSSEAVLGLIHGITTLQPRILRTYGLMINLNNAYAKYAAANNLVANELTVAQRQQAAFQEVLALAPSIAGAYEAAMGTAAKQVRSLKTDIVNLSEAFGEEYTPVINAAVGATRDILHWLTELPDPMQAFLVGAAGSASALAILTGAGLKLIPVIKNLSALFVGLAGASAAAQLALGSFLLAVPLVIGAAAAIAAKEEAHQEEAAAILAAADSYSDYIEALQDANLETRALTEETYNLIKAKEEEEQQEMAKRMRKAQVETESYAASLRDLIFGLDTLTMSEEDAVSLTELWIDQIKSEIIPSLDEQQRALYSNASAWRELLAEAGIAPNLAIDYARELARLTRLEETNAQVKSEVANQTSIENEALMKLESTTRQYTLAVQKAGDAETQRWVAMGDYWTPIIDFEEKRTEAVQKAAEKIVGIEQKAAEAREQANIKLQDSLDDLEIKHALAVAEIYDDIEDLDKNLQDALLENSEERIKLQIALEQKLEDIRIELARRQEDIERERLQDLEDLQIEYNQKREDAARDFAQDLEDMERDHQDRLEDIRRDRQEALLDLEEEYQRRLWEIENAGQLALQKLREDYAEKDSDARLAAARRALELAEQMGIGLSDEMRQAIIDMFRTGAGPEDLLDLLPQDLALIFRDLLEELEKLNDDLYWDQLDLSDDIQKDQERRLEDLEKWLADERAAIEEAHQERLAQEQERIAREREERKREYDDKLEDLRRAQEREREEIERERARKLEDLQRWNQREREEAQRDYQQRLEDLERQLIEENEKNRAALQERLEDEERNYQARLDELNRQHTRRLRDIDDNEKAERAEVETNLQLKLQQYVEGYKQISDAARSGLDQMLLDTQNILADVVQEHRDRIADIQQAWADAGMLGESPAPWWEEMAKSWTEGIRVGFEDEALWSNIAATIGDLQSQVANAPYQQASLPFGMGGNTISNTRTSNLTVNAQYAHQSEASLRDDLSLYNSMLRAWGR